MNICLSTSHLNAPSTVLNSALLQRMHAQFSLNGGFAHQDVILFMNYDPNIEQARKVNPDALIGLIDPRPGSEKHLEQVDFYLANGPEMVNYFSASHSEAFIYPIYPPLPAVTKNESAYTNKDKLIIGYHGNKVHLQLMEETVCPALEWLSSQVPIELRVMFNVSQLGRWDWQPKAKNVVLNQIQWSESGYVEHFSDVDIGIVPNLIPVKPAEDEKLNALKNDKLAHDSDSVYRIKPTSNAGRIFVFFQLGVPVVADMFPSSAECIRYGWNGYLASNSSSWYNALHQLWTEPIFRKTFAHRSRELFDQHYHWDVVNQRLLDFMENLQRAKTPRKRGLFNKMKSLF